MSDTSSEMLPLRTVAKDFELQNAVTGKLQSLKTLKGSRGTLVVFMCNHCPFVKHIIDKLVELADDYQSQGIHVIGINSNDSVAYPDDAPEKMKTFAQEAKIRFPYLIDETQEVAKAYHAVCTPDLFLFDKDLKLVYHGQLDESRPGNKKELTGEDLIVAFENLLANQPQEEVQIPSVGCNIKWK